MMAMAEVERPPTVEQANPPVRRTYDALARADDPLSRSEIEDRTHDAASTVRLALATLRDVGLVERRGNWKLPRYTLAE